MMSETDKTKIAQLRMRGMKYAEIAQELSLNASTVRMYCYRVHLTDEDLSHTSICIHCGARIIQPKTDGKKLFCSERCRSAWRRSTNRLSETLYHHICEGCGVSFNTRGNKGQRFCSRDCYFSHRKGGAV